MKNLALTILFSVNILTGVCQTQTFQAPDYAAIKKSVQDASGPNYYPKLMDRFLALDSSLTANDYRNLYYGFVFQKEYKPYEAIPEEKEFYSFVSRLGTLTPAELDKMIELGNACRKKFPFNSDVANYMWMAYQKKKDFSKALKLSVQSFNILNTIKGSGNGLSQETAYHVLTIGNEYELVRSLSFQPESQGLIGRNFDCLNLKQNKSNIEKLYFNIEKMRDTQKKN